MEKMTVEEKIKQINDDYRRPDYMDLRFKDLGRQWNKWLWMACKDKDGTWGGNQLYVMDYKSENGYIQFHPWSCEYKIGDARDIRFPRSAKAYYDKEHETVYFANGIDHTDFIKYYNGYNK